MKTYEVTLPIAGVAYLTVVADSEEDAISKAMEEVSQDDIEEWSSYRRIVSGNVLHPSHNEATADEIEGEL
jgi:hypothetical protein